MSVFWLNVKQYFNFIAAIAVMHECRLVDIYFWKRSIDICGDARGTLITALWNLHVFWAEKEAKTADSGEAEIPPGSEAFKARHFLRRFVGRVVHHTIIKNRCRLTAGGLLPASEKDF